MMQGIEGEVKEKYFILGGSKFVVCPFGFSNEVEVDWFKKSLESHGARVMSNCSADTVGFVATEAAVKAGKAKRANKLEIPLLKPTFLDYLNNTGSPKTPYELGKIMNMALHNPYPEVHMGILIMETRLMKIGFFKNNPTIPLKKNTSVLYDEDEDRPKVISPTHRERGCQVLKDPVDGSYYSTVHEFPVDGIYTKFQTFINLGTKLVYFFRGWGRRFEEGPFVGTEITVYKDAALAMEVYRAFKLKTASNTAPQAIQAGVGEYEQVSSLHVPMQQMVLEPGQRADELIP